MFAGERKIPCQSQREYTGKGAIKWLLFRYNEEKILKMTGKKLKYVAYYIACRPESDFLCHFYKELVRESGIRKIADMTFVKDVMIKERGYGEDRYLFAMNFSNQERVVTINEKEHVLAGYEHGIWRGRYGRL